MQDSGAFTISFGKGMLSFATSPLPDETKNVQKLELKNASLEGENRKLQKLIGELRNKPPKSSSE